MPYRGSPGIDDRLRNRRVGDNAQISGHILHGSTCLLRMIIMRSTTQPRSKSQGRRSIGFTGPPFSGPRMVSVFTNSDWCRAGIHHRLHLDFDYQLHCGSRVYEKNVLSKIEREALNIA